MTTEIQVEVISLKNHPDYEKCLRCYKYKHKSIIDGDLFFPKVCDRCASVLHTMHYDIAVGNTDMLPIKLKDMPLEEFEEKFVRADKVHLETWKKGIQYDV